MGTAITRQQTREVHFHHTVGKEQGQYSVYYIRYTHIQVAQILLIFNAMAHSARHNRCIQFSKLVGLHKSI